MERKLTFSEKLMRYMKRNKRKTNKQAFLLLFVLVLIIVSTSVVQKFSSPKSEDSLIEANEESFTLGFTGDIMLGRHVEKSLNRTNVKDIMLNLGVNTNSLDYFSGNFEHPIIDKNIEKEIDPEKEVFLSTKDYSMDVIEKLGYNNVNLANNHMFDYLDEGVLNTLKHFEQSDVNYVGAGDNRGAAYQVLYEEIEDKKIATLGFTDVIASEGIARIDEPGVATSNFNVLLNKINEANHNADLVIVHIHWGTEYSTKINKRQEEIAKYLSDAGVDIIVGHHPHVLQKADVIDDTIVFYSLGNFIFDQGWSMTRETAMPIIEWKDDDTFEVSLHPLLIKEGFPKQLNKSEVYFKKRIFNRLKKESSISFKEDKNKLIFESKLNSKKEIK